MKSFSQWRPHPWHGLDVGAEPPLRLNAYIEISPFDTVKFEVDKKSGYLRVDRSVRSSSQHPALYGFIPRTLCKHRVCDLMDGAEQGDDDPLDICVLSERPVSRIEILVNARVVGGLPMCDHGEADDKIIAVIEDDPLWSEVRDISELPKALIDRLMHYFLTYKLSPGKEQNVAIGEPYGFEHASKVIEAAMADYDEEYVSEPERRNLTP